MTGRLLQMATFRSYNASKPLFLLSVKPSYRLVALSLLLTPWALAPCSPAWYGRCRMKVGRRRINASLARRMAQHGRGLDAYDLRCRALIRA